jgi:D-alanine transaminase
MDSICYYDGKLFGKEEPAIPFSDRSVFFGDSVYDACLVKNGRPYLLQAHLDRFFRGLGALRIRFCMNKEQLNALLFSLCEKAKCKIAFLYFQVSRSAPLRRHNALQSDGSHLLITVNEATLPDRNRALSLILTADSRYDFCHVKTTNLLPAVLASTKAANMGADEAVFVRDGTVTECAHSNISILKSGVLYTHPKGRRILSGIGRAQLIKACMQHSIRVIERPFSVSELWNADEILVTSSSKLCLRDNCLMKKPVGMRDEENADRLLNCIFSEFNAY